MKTTIAVLLLVTATTALGQQPGMTPQMQQQLQNMQANMGAMQKCFADLDQQALERLQAEVKEMEAEIKRMCAAGERDAAQSEAMKYGIKLSQDPELQKMRKCSEGFSAAPMPGQFFPQNEEEQESRKHICD